MRNFLLLLLCIVLLVGCNWADRLSDARQKKEQAVKIDRFDRVLDEYVSLNSYSAQQKMNLEYPRETKLLIEDVLAIGHVDEPDIEKRLRRLYLDSTMQTLLDEVHRQYVNITDIEQQLGRAFQRLEKEDPDFPRPHVYTQISCMNQSIVVGDTLIGISLDKYLGSDFPLYKNYFAENQRESMSRENIVPDALTFYLLYRYIEPMPKPWQPDSTDNPAGPPTSMLQHIARVHWVVAKILGVPPRRHIATSDRNSHDIDLSDGLAKVDAYMKQHPKTTLIELLKLNVE